MLQTAHMFYAWPFAGLSGNLRQMFSSPIYDKMEVRVGTDVDPGDTIPDIPDIGCNGGLSDISKVCFLVKYLT